MMRMLGWGLVKALAAIAVFLATAPAAMAGTLHVTNSGDSGQLTQLRQVVGLSGPGDTIVIDPDVNPQIVNGEIVLGNPSITIEGQGQGSTTINVPGSNSRVFVFNEPGGVVRDLRITGGKAPDGADTSSGPGPPGGDGGAILSTEALTLDRVALSGNRAGDGGDTSDIGSGSPPYPPGGHGGNGGAVRAPELTLIDSTLTNNSAGAGGVADTNHGDGGNGGGVYVDGGPLTIIRSTFSSNHGGVGGGGIGSGGEGGFGGGAALVDFGSLNVVESTFTGNVGGTGGGGYLGGTGGSGGGVYANNIASAAITDSTFSNNAAGLGATGNTGGTGGGAYLSVQTIVVSSSTFAGNSAGNGGNGIFGGPPGNGGSGGGLSATATFSGKVVSSTIAGNARGVMGNPNGGPPAANGSGGGVAAGGIPLQIRNSIVAQNAGEPGSANCIGTIDDGGHNLSFPSGAGCPPTFTGGDPLLVGLGANGGPTQTMALAQGSAAIDQVPASSCTDASNAPLTTDQRGVGFPRPAGPACDIGAFEAPEVAVDGGSDTTPPDTTITGGPEGKTKKKAATVSFAGSDGREVSGFQCRLDQGSFEPCTSPKTYSGLKKGAHAVEVRAVDAAGNVDPTPASRSWKVKKKRKKK
jgi:hypothetical protein